MKCVMKKGKENRLSIVGISLNNKYHLMRCSVEMCRMVKAGMVL